MGISPTQSTLSFGGTRHLRQHELTLDHFEGAGVHSKACRLIIYKLNIHAPQSNAINMHICRTTNYINSEIFNLTLYPILLHGSNTPLDPPQPHRKKIFLEF